MKLNNVPGFTVGCTIVAGFLSSLGFSVTYDPTLDLTQEQEQAALEAKAIKRTELEEEWEDAPIRFMKPNRKRK